MKASTVHFDLRNRHYRAWREWLAQTEDWSRDRIEAWQLDQLREVVARAHRTTAGYRALYGDRAPDLDSLSALRALPTVDKETIRDELERFTSSRHHARYVTTGGSSGIPFGFYRDNVAFARELASKAHLYARIGWKEGDPQLVLRGLVISSRNRMQFYPRFNELRCSSYHLEPEQMDAYRRRALDYRPLWLRCYPSSGYIFARRLLETGHRIPGLRGVLCASENLYDHQREAMHAAFGCRIFSHYGHYELAALAGFCEHEDTYHVLPQYGYVELLDRSGLPVTRTGEVGEIVATSFIMRATPFVRYRTGDLAVYRGEGCPACGRPHSIWERIEGRLQEFIVTGGGRLISMTAMNMHDDVFDPIKQFQFEQKEPGIVTFSYLPKGPLDRETEADIARRLLIKLGADVELRMQPVTDFAPTKRGKHRFLVQHLVVPFHDE